MKKILFMTASVCAALTLASCQKAEITEKNAAREILSHVNVTAAPAPGTKVSYSENAEVDLIGKWVTGDVIYGWTSTGDKISFAVESVAKDGVATLSQTTSVGLANGDAVYAIYCPLGNADQISEGELHLDFSQQEKSVIPMLLLSEATVSGGSLSFHFRNAVSIVGIASPQIASSSTGKKVTSFTVSGPEICCEGDVTLNGDALSFTPSAPSKFITKTIGDWKTVAGADASHTTTSYSVYIVVPGGTVDMVSINRGGTLFAYNVGKAIEPGKYYYIKGKEFANIVLPTMSGLVAGGVEWAKWNLGATAVTGTSSFGDVY
ncbi:MAG: fimbrillin family protein, partial [Bacteroidales bacterium]|nr:fimbrillin family protein [Bacteroidales bacterium]